MLQTVWLTPVKDLFKSGWWFIEIVVSQGSTSKQSDYEAGSPYGTADGTGLWRYAKKIGNQGFKSEPFYPAADHSAWHFDENQNTHLAWFK